MDPTLYIVDSYALAFRSFYAFVQNPLINSRGEQTSIVFGYLSAILRLINEQSADYLTIATDLPAPTFRHLLYPEYKANRKEMPEEMQEQIPLFEELVRRTRIPVRGTPGLEADDLIGALALQSAQAGWSCKILSKDKDLMQLVNDRISLIQLERFGQPPTVTDSAAVEEKWGVPPSKVRDLLALMGDTSDNIPGVPGVGPKKGAALLQEWGSLDGILENIDKISAKALKKNLEESRELLTLSRQLVTLRTEIDQPFLPEEYRLAGLFDTEAIARFCHEHELFSLLKPLRQAEQRLGITTPVETEAPLVETELQLRQVATETDWEELLQALEQAERVAVDTETDSLESRHARMVGLCLAADETTGWYLPFGHAEGENLPLEEARNRLEPHLHRPGLRWVFHNGKYDLQVLRNGGWRVPEEFDDTLIASWCLNPGERVHSLDEQAARRLKHRMIPISDLIGTGKNQSSFDQVPIETAAPYGAEDGVMTLRLWNVLEKELEREGLAEHYRRDELPLVELLRKMEGRGIAIDTEALAKLSVELEQELGAVQEKIWAMAGEPFNIASPQQVGEVLFQTLGLQHGKKTKTGAYSTNAAVLEELRWEHPIVDLILNYREWTKLNGTYVDVLPEMIDPLTGRLHTSFLQTVAATGRLSSVEPNLQNIPIRSGWGAQIRAAFVASDSDHLLLSADYSQIELRVLAHLSQDPTMIRAYEEKSDIHARTAALLLQIPLEMVSERQRRQAKAVNFGVIYGMSPFRLSKEQGIPFDHARDFIESYFSHFSEVQRWIDETVQQARRDGFSATLYGHRRPIPELSEENRNLQARGERQAVNSVIQGTAADLMKRAMIRVEQAIEQSGLRAELLLQVHDELVFEVHKEDAEAAGAIIRREMEGVEKLRVPLVVDIGTGSNWLKAH